MIFQKVKTTFTSLALAGAILGSGVASNSTVLAAAGPVPAQDHDWRQDRRPSRDERERFRREEREELSRIRELDRQHRLRYRTANRVRSVGYFDGFGNFHQYGYYDRWGFFHRY